VTEDEELPFGIVGLATLLADPDSDRAPIDAVGSSVGVPEGVIDTDNKVLALTPTLCDCKGDGVDDGVTSPLFDNIAEREADDGTDSLRDAAGEGLIVLCALPLMTMDSLDRTVRDLVDSTLIDLVDSIDLDASGDDEDEDDNCALADMD
jgi:hypothetical protein